MGMGHVKIHCLSFFFFEIYDRRENLIAMLRRQSLWNPNPSSSPSASQFRCFFLFHFLRNNNVFSSPLTIATPSTKPFQVAAPFTNTCSSSSVHRPFGGARTSRTPLVSSAPSPANRRALTQQPVNAEFTPCLRFQNPTNQIAPFSGAFFSIIIIRLN